MEKNMKVNFKFLKERVVDSLNNTDLEYIRSELSQLRDSTIFSGVGGSSVVSEFGAKVISAKNDIIAINERIVGLKQTLSEYLINNGWDKSGIAGKWYDKPIWYPIYTFTKSYPHIGVIYFKYSFAKTYDESNISPDIHNVIKSDNVNLLFFGNINDSSGVNFITTSYLFSLYSPSLGTNI